MALSQPQPEGMDYSKGIGVVRFCPCCGNEKIKELPTKYALYYVCENSHIFLVRYFKIEVT